jgi:imidazolonepropionase
VVVDKDGRIFEIGKSDELVEKYKAAQFNTKINCEGKSVVPGLCDSHTHAVYAGDRVHEFVMKLNGATYMDIHKMGGGIGFTVKKVRASSEEDLLKSLVKDLKKMATFGSF